jgi:hypothetical protein
MFQIYLNKDLHVYDNKNIIEKKLNSNNDYYILNILKKYADINIENLLDKIYDSILYVTSNNKSLFQIFFQNNEFEIMKRLINNNYLSFVTKLPENSIVLNEDKPYEL